MPCMPGTITCNTLQPQCSCKLTMHPQMQHLQVVKPPFAIAVICRQLGRHLRVHNALFKHTPTAKGRRQKQQCMCDTHMHSRSRSIASIAHALIHTSQLRLRLCHQLLNPILPRIHFVQMTVFH